MATSSFDKDFIINSNKVAKRLERALSKSYTPNKRLYQEIDIDKELNEGSKLALRHFSNLVKDKK